MPPVHPDPFNPKHREVIAHLRAQHLAGIDADDEGAIALEIEMSRVIMLGAGAALGLAISKSLDTSKPMNWTHFWIAISLLVASIFVSWVSLYLGTLVRRKRVQRKYDIYFGELNERLAAESEGRPAVPDTYTAHWPAQFAKEDGPRTINNALRIVSAALAALGIVLLLFTMKTSFDSYGRKNPVEPVCPQQCCQSVLK